jgi:hypothetical protein
VSRGAYLDGRAWQELGPRERYLLRIRAVAETRRNRPVISHWSAAAVHGLPMIAEWPSSVHVTQPLARGSRSRNGVVRHSLRLEEPDVIEIDGMLVTTIARTLLDVAAVAPQAASVAMVDFALHVDRFGRRGPLVTQDELLELWESSLPFRGHVRSRDVIEFGETAADTPLESVSRVNMRKIGCPRPLLQAQFRDADGFIGESDFYWEDCRVVGEADGDRKYLDEAFRSGRTPEQVLLDEKVREDRIRALGNGFGRWRWTTANDPAALRRKLLATGLPTGVPWR